MPVNSKRKTAKDTKEIELKEKLVNVKRVVKVVKGGRRFRFAALVVVGDGKGRVGFGTGKAKEIPDAVKKAVQQAKNTMIHVSMRESRTLHHDITGKFGAGKVILRSAPAGTGVIAGGAMRSLFEVMGMHDVVAKSVGTSNPDNLIRATMKALKAIVTPKMLANFRDKKISEITNRRKSNKGIDKAIIDADNKNEEMNDGTN
ncbi:30S ribosomal protein S5 [Rickettsiales bacterium LUAb2]